MGSYRSTHAVPAVTTDPRGRWALMLSAQTQQHRISLFQHMGQWARSAGMAAASTRGALPAAPGGLIPGLWASGHLARPAVPPRWAKKVCFARRDGTVVVRIFVASLASEREARAPLSFTPNGFTNLTQTTFLKPRISTSSAARDIPEHFLAREQSRLPHSSH